MIDFQFVMTSPEPTYYVEDRSPNEAPTLDEEETVSTQKCAWICIHVLWAKITTWFHLI